MKTADLSPKEIELIKKHRQEQELKKVKEWQPTPANQISVEKKCAAFDSLHAQALEHFSLVAEEGYQDTDDQHYMYEEVMKLLGPDVFDVMNKLDKLAR